MSSAVIGRYLPLTISAMNSALVSFSAAARRSAIACSFLAFRSSACCRAEALAAAEREGLAVGMVIAYPNPPRRDTAATRGGLKVRGEARGRKFALKKRFRNDHDTGAAELQPRRCRCSVAASGQCLSQLKV